MKRYLAYDIETVPTIASMEGAYPEESRQPPANYSKPETIAKWREKDREEWKETRIKEHSLSPRTGRIVAMSFNHEGESFTDLTALRESDEKSLLENALQLIFHDGVDVCVGFNNKGFDWPFFVTRCLYHRINVFDFCRRVEWRQMFNRYSLRHIDAWLDFVSFGSGYRTKGSLSDWMRFLGLAPKETKGSDIYEWVQAGDIDKVREHCRYDVAGTGAIFERFYPLYEGS